MRLFYHRPNDHALAVRVQHNNTFAAYFMCVHKYATASATATPFCLCLLTCALCVCVCAE